MVKTSSAKELGVFWLHAWLLARCKIHSYVCICLGFILKHGKHVYLVSVCGGRAGSLLNCCAVAACSQPQGLYRISVPLKPEKRWHICCPDTFILHMQICRLFLFCSVFRFSIMRLNQFILWVALVHGLSSQLYCCWSFLLNLQELCTNIKRKGC